MHEDVSLYDEDKRKFINIKHTNMKKNYKISLRYALATLTSIVCVQGALAQENLPTDAGSILTAGTTYKVSSDITINEQQAAVDDDGKPVSGLVVAGGSPVIIEICKGCTLTVNGTHAAGQYGAGAGISVPSSSTLIITGEGTLIAQGGNAGNGGDGERGKNPLDNKGSEFDINKHTRLDLWDRIWSYTGAGGAGGYGGGGAGAGIGGAGGDGGAGGVGGGTGDANSDNYSWSSGDASLWKDVVEGGQDGRPGKDGGEGKVGPSVGKVYINGTVTVNAIPGNAGVKNGIGGQSSGYSVFRTGIGTIGGYAIAGGGGAGAGGGAGFAAPYGIGVGGRGAGGGGGGGGGAADRVDVTSYNDIINKPNYRGTANSCLKGGLGALGLADSQKGTQTSPADSGYGDVASSCPRKGGAAGASGEVEVEPAKGDAVHGVVYVASTAKLNEGSASTAIGAIEIAPYSVTAINDNNTNATPGVYGMSTINSALEAIKYDENITSGTSVTFTLNKDANVGSTTLTNPDKAVTLDLNGKGLLVDGAAGDITGNANVTILLKDGNNRAAEYGTDNVPYANESPINGSPIKYTRKISSVQSGNWQSLYLPFEAKRPADTNIGVVNKVEIDETSARLWIDKLDDDANLAAYTPYFIQHAEGEFEIEAATTTLVAYKKNAPAAIEGGDYTIAGSLKSTDRVSEAEKNFWSMTNGGGFSWVKVGVGQRPYRWVIYGDPQDATNAAGKIMTLFVLGVDDTTTGVQDIMVADSNDVYTISGMKLSNKGKLARGLYISNGKKFYVK